MQQSDAELRALREYVARTNALPTMPTAAERHALAFLAGVALLGGGVQVLRQRATHVNGTSLLAAESVGGESVNGQLSAVDAARASRSGKKANTRRKPKVRVADTAESTRNVDRDAPLMIDVDRAGAQELELLPRVGPALAARIVADRDSLGPFGSLEEFGRVRGIGPSLLKMLEPVTTFSGTAISRANRSAPQRSSRIQHRRPRDRLGD